MPKTHKAFPCTINLGVTLETKQRLSAVGYFTGNGGEYASPARNFIEQALGRWLESLTEKERKNFDAILENVKIEVTK